MSTATHTPGPWRALTGPRKTSNFDQTYRQTVLGAPVDGHADPAAYAIGFAREEAQANAHLIAAAPDLLAALRALDLHCTSDLLNPCWREGRNQPIGTHWGSEPGRAVAACPQCAARGAIAKAEGRAS